MADARTGETSRRSPTRIPDQLGISLHVKIRLHRARVRLRAALAEECDFSRDERGVLFCEPKRGKPDA